MSLPADSHVHTEWSWDAPGGSMEASCEAALRIGLPAVAFTEHVDHTTWTVALDALEPDDHLATLAEDGRLTPPPFDAEGYLAAIERCRARYPDLRILSGLELGEPHWHSSSVREVLASGSFDRVLGSLHCLPDGEGHAEPPGLYAHREPAEVMRTYLAEITELALSDEPFGVLAHVDYPVRSWPAGAARFDPRDFEEELRHALRATASSGRALELNTRVPLSPRLLQWWHEEGGEAITFGSDAHDAASIARGFRDARDLAEATGFRPGADPYDLWRRVD